MATSAVEMGEIEEIHSKDAEGVAENILNGDQSDAEMETEENQVTVKRIAPDNNKIGEENNEAETEEAMEVDEDANSVDDSRDVVDGKENGSINEDESTGADDDSQTGSCSETALYNNENSNSGSTKNDEVNIEDEIDEEVHEIDDDDSENDLKTDEKIDETIELNDSESDQPNSPNPLENGNNNKSEMEIIELVTPEKEEKDVAPSRKISTTPRRSSRNLNKTRSYEEELKIGRKKVVSQSSESDIEEILPEDPLASIGDAIQIEKIPIRRKPLSNINDSSTIVVKDTKRLVEIASKSSPPTSGKKEPTLVIIDTNSILSGRGPVPVNKSSSSSSSFLPMALPAQGMYPPNMRATITPIPMNNSSGGKSNNNNNNHNSTSTPVLPTLTDDMFVVEAPSFIVPYVYEKPPVGNLKTFLLDYKKELNKDKGKGDEKEVAEENNEEKDEKKDDDSDKEDEKMYSYFGSPLGKFFIEIGLGLVQEFVQNDLLRQQKRKRDREHGKNPETIRTIQSLTKNLEYTKENNEPFRLPMKRCEFCPFKTESALALSYHLETPHVKNYIYKCNFCTYESRSPHDILFHMEAEHMVRGRLERALSFHQCPNCPFEENQKGKLSRHLLACAKKFKPERNLEPPLEWEPPAKIPRVPKMRQNLNASAAYQALSKQSQQQQQQLQLLAKMQLQASNFMSGKSGRGAKNLSLKGTQLLRGSNVPGMVYKQAMSGGSVLVPTNYQLSGNQVFTVVGGQEIYDHLSTSNYPGTTQTAQQQGSPKSKTVNTPSISITPLPRASTSSTSSPGGGGGSNNTQQVKPGDTNSKNSFVICEICDGYIKDLEQLRNHMQWIHKVKIHPKMIYNRPPLNCQKCQFRFFTDQGLERHLLGSHGLVTSSMQEAANRSKDAGRCPVCGRVYQWKLLNHVARDHNMTLKPAHLSYKCTVCTATFGMYKQFENHVYSAHSVVAKRVMDKKGSSSSSNSKSSSDQALKPLKINDEITIIPQPPKAGSSKEGASKNSTHT